MIITMMMCNTPQITQESDSKINKFNDRIFLDGSLITDFTANGKCQNEFYECYNSNEEINSVDREKLQCHF